MANGEQILPGVNHGPFIIGATVRVVLVAEDQWRSMEVKLGPSGQPFTQLKLTLLETKTNTVVDRYWKLVSGAQVPDIGLVYFYKEQASIPAPVGTG